MLIDDENKWHYLNLDLVNGSRGEGMGSGEHVHCGKKNVIKIQVIGKTITIK